MNIYNIENIVSEEIWKINATLATVLAIQKSGYFDHKFYESQYPEVISTGLSPIEHYVLYGAKEGKNPNYWFNTSDYLKKYPDVKVEHINPFWHYLRYGKDEGRNIESVKEFNIIHQTGINSIKRLKQITGVPYTPENRQKKIIYYKDIKEYLQESKIFFSVDGSHRFADDTKITFPESAQIEPYVAFLGGTTLCTMGSFSYSWSPLNEHFFIGRYCSIAGGLSLFGTRHPYEYVSNSSFVYDKNFIIFKKVQEKFNDKFLIYSNKNPVPQIIIGHDVWIGGNVTLKRNISIGIGAVVAANSVVTKDVMPYSIVGGNPAQFIKMRFNENIVEKMLNIEWWKYSFYDFKDIDITNPEYFCSVLEERIQLNKISPFTPKVFSLDVERERERERETSTLMLPKSLSPSPHSHF